LHFLQNLESGVCLASSIRRLVSNLLVILPVGGLLFYMRVECSLIFIDVVIFPPFFDEEPAVFRRDDGCV
jgi:hypothetical protein